MGKEGGGQRTTGRRKKRFSILAWPDSRFTWEEVKLQLSCWREIQSFINPGKSPGKERQQKKKGKEKSTFLKTRVKGRFFPPHERARAARPNSGTILITALARFPSCPKRGRCHWPFPRFLSRGRPPLVQEVPPSKHANSSLCNLSNFQKISREQLLSKVAEHWEKTKYMFYFLPSPLCSEHHFH